MSISQFASGMSGQVSEARLLYGMGCDSITKKDLWLPEKKNIIPQKILYYWDYSSSFGH